MKLLNEKKTTTKPILTVEEKVEEFRKEKNIYGGALTLETIAFMAYCKYGNWVFDAGLDLKQNVLDNIGLMLGEMSSQSTLTCAMLMVQYVTFLKFLNKRGFYRNYKALDEHIKNGDKITSSLFKLKAKKTASKACGVLFGSLGYLATTTGVGFELTGNLASVVTQNVYWAIEGAINNPLISLMFLVPTIASCKLVAKYDNQLFVCKQMNKMKNNVEQTLPSNTQKQEIVCAEEVNDLEELFCIEEDLDCVEEVEQDSKSNKEKEFEDSSSLF